jgi:predicted transcriptional regulator
MNQPPTPETLGARERQIMDAIFELGEASVADVRVKLPDPPSYSAVRTMIRLLETKGLLKHRQVGIKYVYTPSQKPDVAKRSALQHVMKTFFAGSAADAVAAILDSTIATLTDDEIKRLEKLIQEARKKGK